MAHPPSSERRFLPWIAAKSCVVECVEAVAIGQRDVRVVV